MKRLGYREYRFRGRRNPARGGAADAWSRVFHATCAGIEQGAWPPGFAAWIGTEAPWDAQQRFPSAPPPALQRVLPWVVALGA